MTPQRIPGLDRIAPPRTRRRQVLRKAVPGKARKALRTWLRARAQVARPAAKPAVVKAKPAPPGKVTRYRRGGIEGWVTLAEGAAAVPVVLYLGGVEVMTTVATPSPHAEPGSRQGIFRFQTRGLWEFAQAEDRISVLLDGKALPIAKHGRCAVPVEVGPRTIAELGALLADGQVFSRWGDLQVVKSKDLTWIDAVLDLYDTVAKVLYEDFEYESFVIYGSLLGTIREGGVIGVDNDADMAYVSRHRKNPALAEEMRDIALRLIEIGLRTTIVSTNLYVWNPDRPEVRIDLFHLYWDRNDILAFPFGVAGTRDVTRSQWQGVTTASFCHRIVGVPELAEEVVAAMYGESWRVPNSGFSWKKDRRTAGIAGRIPPEIWGPTNWEDHYARVEIAEPSGFARALLDRPDLPHLVVDLGSGCGRDALALAASDRRVLGVDRSARAVDRARKRSVDAKLTVPAHFEVLDLGAPGALPEATGEFIAAAGEAPVLFYARFLFHALAEDAQAVVLADLSKIARRGDVVAAEFRSIDDEKLPKNSAKMFRRFLDPAAFDADLVARGFEIVESCDGVGFSRQQKEDPVLHRVIARRA